MAAQQTLTLLVGGSSPLSVVIDAEYFVREKSAFWHTGGVRDVEVERVNLSTT